MTSKKLRVRESGRVWFCIDALEHRRLLAQIGLDVSFGAGGTVDVPSGELLHVLPDGKILSAGVKTIFEDNDTDEEMIISRLDPDGTLDKTFGHNGELNPASFGAATFADNRIYVANEADTVTAYTIDGVVDTAFGDGGSVGSSEFSTSVDGVKVDFTETKALAPSPGGGLIVYSEAFFGGSSTKSFAAREFVHLKPDGTIDPSFGDQGYITSRVLFGGYNVAGVVVNSTGIYLPDNQHNLTHYTLSGKLDASYGNQGKANFGFDLGSIALQADGKVIVAPDPALDKNDRMLRFNADGTLDNTFGKNGVVPLVDSKGKSINGDAIFLDEQQRIYVEGSALFRYSTSGVLDSSPPFNGSLKDRNGRALAANALAIDSTGKILLATGGVSRLGETQPVELGSDHTLYVNGTDGDDSVHIAAGSKGKLSVVFNKTSSSFNLADVKGLNLTLLDEANSALISIDLPATITSGSGADTLTTANAADSIDARTGNDSIITAGGDDTVLGSAGDKYINCGDGNDSVRTDEANDSKSHSTIIGGDGNKSIFYYSDGTGNVIQLGTGNSSVVTGGLSTNDTVTIAGGSNSVSFGGGMLTIGGAGKNSISVYANAPTTVTTGGGNDTITVAGDTAATINAGAGDDRITVSDGLHDVVYGGDGKDRIIAGDGSQTLVGGAGRDTIHGGAGGDLISGGGGDDRLFGDSGDDHIYGGSGNDSIDAGSGNDLAFGQDGRDHIYGGSGDDQLSGGAGADWIYSQRGNDALFGDGGNDRLFADYDAGTDTLHGGAGDDIFVTADGLKDSLFGDSGTDSASADAKDALNSIEIS